MVEPMKNKTMKKTGYRKRTRWLCGVAALWTLVSVLVMAAYAAETSSTFSCFGLSASSNGKVEIATTDTGWKILAYGTDGACDTKNSETVNFTITNTGTKGDGSVRAVDFKITTTGMDKNDTAAAKRLDSTTTSLTYTATSGEGSTTSTTITIDFPDINQESLGTTVITTVKPGVGGTVKVDGTEVTEQTNFEKSDSHTYTLTAAANSGYSFYGWMSSTGPVSTDGALSLSYPGKNENTLWPLFIKTGSAIYYIKGASPLTYYGYLNEAITAAGNSGTIVVHQSGTAYHSDSSQNSYNIPSGVTLLVPYDSANTVITNNMADYVEDAWGGTPDDSGHPARTLYRQLTLPAGASITVASGGSINVGSKASCQMVGQVGPYGAITMGDNSNITLEDKSFLYAWGYINGSGTVTVKKGGTVYECYSVMDYPNDAGKALNVYGGGGSGIGDAAYNVNGGQAFPMRAYTMRNVEVPMTYHSGATGYGFYHIYGMYAGKIGGYLAFIGADQNSVFQLAEGAHVVKSYKDQKQSIKIVGNASLNSMAITVKFLTDIRLDSAKTSGIPMASGFDIEFSGGTLTLNENVIMCEGCSMVIAEKAVVDANGYNIYILDSQDDPGTQSAKDIYGKPYTVVDTDAKLDINGVLKASGGFYTSKNHASIVSSDGTGKIEFTGTSGAGTVFVKSGTADAPKIEVTPAFLQDKDGNAHRVQANTNGTYNYSKAHERWAFGEHTITNEVTAPTCTEKGYTTYTCNACGHSYTGEETAALGHTWKEATCTVAKTCSVCGATEGAALGHTEVIDAAVAATCTETGLTEGKHCSVCDEVLIAQQEIAKKDHTPGSAATCEADQCCTVCGHVIVSASGVHDPAVQGSLCFHKAMIGDAPYETLADAVDAYSTGYIKMIDDSTEPNCVIDGEVYLDLAGKSVTGSVSIGDGGVLYGFDTTTDGYDKRGGSITLTGEPEAVTESPITEGWVYAAYTADSGDGAKTYTFNRTSVYVSDYYMEIIADGTAKVGFAGVFRGNADAALALQDLGFEVNKEEITNGARPDGVQDKFRFSYTGTATGYGDYAVKGLMEFGGTTLTSQYPLIFNFTNVLKSYYDNKADEKAKAAIELFAGKKGITL